MGRGKKRVGEEFTVWYLVFLIFTIFLMVEGIVGKVKMFHLHPPSPWQKLKVPGEPSVRVWGSLFLAWSFCWALTHYKADAKHAAYSVATIRRNRFPCYWILRSWRPVTRDIKLPGTAAHLIRNHTPEKACGTLSWREVEVRGEHPLLGLSLGWRWIGEPSWEYTSPVLRSIRWWGACFPLHPGGDMICRYEQLYMSPAPDGEAKLPNRKEFTSLSLRCGQ